MVFSHKSYGYIWLQKWQLQWHCLNWPCGHLYWNFHFWDDWQRQSWTDKSGPSSSSVDDGSQSSPPGCRTDTQRLISVGLPTVYGTPPWSAPWFVGGMSHFQYSSGVSPPRDVCHILQHEADQWLHWVKVEEVERMYLQFVIECVWCWLVSWFMGHWRFLV